MIIKVLHYTMAGDPKLRVNWGTFPINNTLSNTNSDKLWEIGLQHTGYAIYQLDTYYVINKKLWALATLRYDIKFELLKPLKPHHQ